MRPQRLTLAPAVLLLLAAATWGQTSGKPPSYIRRLEMPVRGDSLHQPRAVVADLNTGEIFVCDTSNSRIVIFDSSGRFRYQIPGGNAFRAPIDLAVDPEGYIFVVGQLGDGVKLLDFDGKLIQDIELVGIAADLGPPRISSIALSPDGSRLFALDPANHRLWITDREGVVLESVDLAAGRSPKEIAELRYGHVDVYDDTALLTVPTDGLVYLFDLEGNSLGTIGVRGTAPCQTMFPAAAALDDRGRVLILDQQRALFMTWDRERGICLSEHYGFGNVPGAFYQPNDLALDSQGRVYVSQGFEGRVQVYEGARPAAGSAADAPRGSAP